MASPALGPDGGQLSDVVAFSDSDVWAAGPATDTHHAAIFHWNGRRWTSVPGPSLSATTNSVSSLAGSGPHDVWVSGASFPLGNDTRSNPFVLHWDGRNWTTMPLPPLRALRSSLNSLAVIGPDDVWAVGFYGSGGEQALAEHWDGRSWRRSPLPLPRTGSSVHQNLISVVARSSSDVWAVGRDQGGSSGSPIVHWDGTTWAVLPGPSKESLGALAPHVAPGDVEGVIPVGASEVWFVGSAARARVVGGRVETLGGSIPMFLRWNGRSWSLSQAAPPMNADDWFEFEGAASGPDGTGWVVGTIHPKPGISSQPITYRLRGSQWVSIETPFIEPAPLHMDDGRSNGLSAVSVTAAGTAWAVGHMYTADSPGNLPLVERCP